MIDITCGGIGAWDEYCSQLSYSIVSTTRHARSLPRSWLSPAVPISSLAHPPPQHQARRTGSQFLPKWGLWSPRTGSKRTVLRSQEWRCRRSRSATLASRGRSGSRTRKAVRLRFAAFMCPREPYLVQHGSRRSAREADSHTLGTNVERQDLCDVCDRQAGPCESSGKVEQEDHGDDG